jgi:hypothetical protein
MIAYKFLQAQRVSPFSGFKWQPDEWVRVDGPLVPCQSGVHACNTDQLAYWLMDELWAIELAGEIQVDELQLVAERGRLAGRIDSFGETSAELAELCLRRVALHAAAELRDASLDAEASELDAASPEELVEAARRAVRAADAARAPVASKLAQYVEDAVEWADALPPSGVAFVAAYSAASRSRQQGDAFAAERLLQSRWLADRLALTASDA